MSKPNNKAVTANLERLKADYNESSPVGLLIAAAIKNPVTENVEKVLASFEAVSIQHEAAQAALDAVLSE